MTLNILFLTITLKRRVIDTEELLRQEQINQLMEENKNRILNYYRTM